MAIKVLVAFSFIFLVQATQAEPVARGAIEVMDGDSIRVGAKEIRLVGFDTPEGGINARCERERVLAAKATSRLRQIIAGGGLD
jgi:endonuclease YncB( thermonuclease family)